MKLCRTLLLTLISAIGGLPSANAQQLIIKENFSKPLDPKRWQLEIENAPGSFVKAGAGKLVLQTGAGVTVWLKIKLHANIRISYDRVVVDKGGAQDRLSDLNQFWMATDPAVVTDPANAAGLPIRDGQLDAYNSLKLYYVGMGGNTNTTTRFRRYDGKGNRTLIAEQNDSGHLLKANHKYHIELVVNNGQVSFWVDHRLFFSFTDPEALKEGYFGFRSTKSHQEISSLKIYQLP